MVVEEVVQLRAEEVERRQGHKNARTPPACRRCCRFHCTRDERTAEAVAASAAGEAVAAAAAAEAVVVVVQERAYQ